MANALRYKPKEAGKKFPQGIATINAGDKKARITFTGENAPEFDNGENHKDFPLSELPKTPRIAANTKGQYFVKLNRDADEVLSVGPVEGVFSAKVVDLSRPADDQDPAPYEITPQKEGWASYLAFNAYFEISKGTFKGTRISQFHHYKFTTDGDGETIWDGQVDNSKAKWLPKLVEFCEKTGCIDEPIQWPKDGNVLPELLGRILEKEREIKIVVKNGYIDSLMSDFQDEMDADEDFPPVKAKPKVKKISNKKHVEL